MRAISPRIMEAENKAAALREAAGDPGVANRFEVDLANFTSVPGASFAW
jgi:hypothetical protein